MTTPSAYASGLYRSRAASPVTISRANKDGVLEVVEVRPAGTIDTARMEVDNKRGPKPGSKKKSDPNKFAESENNYAFYE